MNIGIVGAGLLGRLLAYRLTEAGWKVTLFDKNDASGKGAAAYAAGGMLSLIAEQEHADPLIYQLGEESLRHWEAWLSSLKQRVFFQKKGGILVSHANDSLELDYIAERISKRVGVDKIKKLDRADIQKMEPELDFQKAYFLADEAQIDARALLEGLLAYLTEQGVSLHFNTNVTALSPHLVTTNHNTFEFDWVFDCRGVAAQERFSDLRAVRGELIYLSAPEVHLNHVIRFFHPRYRLYIIPRPNQMYLIGATEIEACDDSPISVRSCLELLSAVYTLHKGFSEARLIETVTGLRPAFPDNLPRLSYQPGLIAMNGLYRHGFLLAPALVNEVVHFLSRGHVIPAKAGIHDL